MDKAASRIRLPVLSDKNANIVQERSFGWYKYNKRKSSTTNAMLLIIVI